METEPKKVGAVWHGMLPADADIYRRAGWNFLAGKNLPPSSSEQKALEAARKPKESE